MVIFLILWIACSFFSFRRILYFYYSSNSHRSYFSNSWWFWHIVLSILFSIPGPFTIVSLVTFKTLQYLHMKKIIVPKRIFMAAPREKREKEYRFGHKSSVS